MSCPADPRPAPAEPRPGPAARRPRRGFTLIELVIALALLSIVLSLVYAAFFQVSRGATQLKATLTEQQELRLLLKLVSDDLLAVQYLPEHAKARPGNTSAFESGIVAETDHLRGQDFSNVRFHAAVPARFHRTVLPERDPGLQELAYWVQENEERTGLELVRREDFYLSDDLRTGGIAVPLHDRMASFTVEFLKPLDPDLPDEWVPTWNSNEQAAGAWLPRALRLTLGFLDEKGEPRSASLTLNLPPSMEVVPPPAPSSAQQPSGGNTPPGESQGEEKK